jgi:pimeloyl-ACP methyl ester carboxylesterase
LGQATVITEEAMISVAGGEVFVKKWTPPLLFEGPLFLLHDSLGSVASWGHFPDKLSEVLGRQVIAYDRFGFGRSRPRTEPLPPNFVCEEAEIYFPALLAAFQTTAFSVLGHSTGGSMALEIAARHPGCAAVVTLAAQAFVDPVTVAKIRTTADEHRALGLRALHLRHGKKASWVLKCWLDVWTSEAFSHWSLGESLSQIRCPTLVLHGKKDEYGSLGAPEYIQQKSRGPVEIGWLRDSGHSPHRDSENLVLEKIQIFFRNSSQGRNERPSIRHS